MAEDEPALRFRFGIYEADASTGELRRQGVRVRLNAQPFQVLCLLLRRPGELLTRDEICRELWPDGTVVDYEHGVNSAVNRIREALGDTAASPRYIQTLARRGYRFLAPVERIPEPITFPVAARSSRPIPALPAKPNDPANSQSSSTVLAESTAPGSIAKARRTILASPDQLPKLSHTAAQTLFVLFQVMYLGFYVGALANLPEIQELVSVLAYPLATFVIIVATAAILIPARAYMVTAVLLRAPGMRARILTIWPFLLVFDELWALSPFLLLHHINFGVAVACTALLVYAPFAQRSLVLMGAGAMPPQRADIS
jgi:cholera toxin transcriptional activator